MVMLIYGDVLNAKVRKCENDNTEETLNLTQTLILSIALIQYLTLTLNLTKILTLSILIGVFCMLFFCHLSHFRTFAYCILELPLIYSVCLGFGTKKSARMLITMSAAIAERHLL